MADTVPKSSPAGGTPAVPAKLPAGFAREAGYATALMRALGLGRKLIND